MDKMDKWPFAPQKVNAECVFQQLYDNFQILIMSKLSPKTHQKTAKKLPKRPKRRVSGRYWRLVIPHLSAHGVRPPRSHAGLARLKRETLDLLHAHEVRRGLVNWCIAWQTHPGSGFAHLDILLVYAGRVRHGALRYDYLVKHGHLRKYRTLNAAILDYGAKQDPAPLSNLDRDVLLAETRAKSGLYAMMQQAMFRNPFEFDPFAWLHEVDLYRVAVRSNLFRAVRAVRECQRAHCNSILKAAPGIRPITREFVERVLSERELEVYDSWPGYAAIVSHLNQISEWGGRRPHKTSNLLIVGRPNTGKTALALEIKRHCPVYFKGVSTWFPAYKSGVYTLTLWNEFSLAGLPFSDILNFLEGVTMDLQFKGGMTRKFDNPLVYMTSNLTLGEHIRHRFKSARDREHARLNLSARIREVVIPDGLDLFLLLRLIAPAAGTA